MNYDVVVREGCHRHGIFSILPDDQTWSRSQHGPFHSPPPTSHTLSPYLTELTPLLSAGSHCFAPSLLLMLPLLPCHLWWVQNCSPFLQLSLHLHWVSSFPSLVPFSSEKCLFKFFLKLCYLEIFCYWVIGVPRIFWKLTPYTIYMLCNIFSNYMDCLFTLLVLSFAMQKLFSLKESHLSIFALAASAFSAVAMKSSDQCGDTFLLCFLAGVL